MKNTVAMRFVVNVGEVGKMTLKNGTVDTEIHCDVEYSKEELETSRELINDQMDRLVSDTKQYMIAINEACDYLDPIIRKIQDAVHNAGERTAKNRSFINKLYIKLRKEEKKEETNEE